MKTLACVLALMVSAVAYAQTTIDLRSPQIFQYNPPNRNCLKSTAPAWTIANGFSADANYVNGVSFGYIVCAGPGRGNLITTRYCMFDVWDLAGNLVSVTNQPYTTCASIVAYGDNGGGLAGEQWTDAAGYKTYTVTLLEYGYIESRYAVLETP